MAAGRKIKRLLLGSILCSAGFLWTGVMATAQQETPIDAGREIFAAACTGCHETAVITAAGKSASEWEASVTEMVELGAPLLAGERQPLVQYLAKYYGPEPASSTAAQATAQEPASTSDLSGPDARGRRVVQEACSVCHELVLIYQSRRSPSEWEEMVNDMIGRGAAMLDGERELLVQFLANYYGPENPKTNINQASAQQLMTAFGLSQAEAEEVVRYRQQHGTILGWESLRRVQGLELRKLEDKKEQLAFF